MTRGMRTRGPTLSALRRAGSLLGAGLASCLVASCLVTDQIEYDRPNTPPQVIKQEPLGFRTVPLFGDPECATAGSGRLGWMNFPIRVRDVDVDDELEYRVIVNKKQVYTADITPPNGKPERDDQTYCVEKERLNEACLHVEILVSRRFADRDGRDPYKTREPNDLGYAEWWVLGRNFPEVGISTCEDSSGGAL